MVVELGHFALIVALLVTLVQAVLPLVGAARGVDTWMAVGVVAARVQFVCLCVAFIALMYAFIAKDFSVLYVAQNSTSTLPVEYRISAVWGAHEGSMLLWALILGGWIFLAAGCSGSLSSSFRARMLGVLGVVSSGFLFFILLTSNPFERLFPAALEGADLNPLLQDPGLIMHPPILYTGYVGFAVVFAFAVAALLENKHDHMWVRWVRPWAVIAWVFLTVGIALGSWWAYYELGWGGWWFWDPVENASFMPWLLGTALIHSLAVTDKRDLFRSWTVLLAIGTFTLSVLGTFLVRSGVLTSVHAFATDPTRGIFILLLMGVYAGVPLMLFIWHAAPRTSLTATGFKPMSRETFLLTNSLLLVVCSATVLLGTLYPLAVDALGLGKLSVGAPYFNAVFIPLMVLVAMAMGVGPLVYWRADEWRRLLVLLRPALVGSVIVGLLCAWLLRSSRPFDGGGIALGAQTTLGIALAAWVLMAMITALAKRCRSWQACRHTPAGFYGMCLAHAGLAVTICGVTMTSLYGVQSNVRMGAGDAAQLAGYTYTLNAIRAKDGVNYRADEAQFSVTRGQRRITVLTAEKRRYTIRGDVMTEAGIDAGVWRDLYVSLGEPLGGGDWSVLLQYKPLIRWIWGGAILMALGGVITLFDARYRTRTAVVGVAAEGLIADGR